MKKFFANRTNKKLIVALSIVAAIVACCLVLTLGSFTKIDQFASAQESDEAIELVYQAQAELQVGDTQNVAVTFKEATDAPQSKVVYRKVDSDVKLILDVDKVEDNIAYYSVELADDSYVGTYIFDKVVWGDSGNEYKKTINDDSNFLGQFNCTYASESDEDLPAGIYSIGADGQLSVISTLDNTNNSNVMAMTADAMASLGNIQQNGAVVALDPGHGGGDPGAVSGGLQEKNLNWAIAMSCRSELEQYGGVSVYITRGEDECPGLRDRVERARAAGACIFVSLHINSGGGTGAEVWVQRGESTWAIDTHNRGVDVANRVLDKICNNLGLGKRGVKEKASTNGSQYPDHSLGDYYSVLYWSRWHSIPGIIIEHAFIDGDNGFLSNGNNLHMLGIYDAQAIAESYGWQKGTSGGENIVGTYHIEMSASSNAVIDVADSSTAEKANVQIGAKTPERAASQKWRIVTDKDGWAVIWNVNSGLVLDVEGGSSEPRTNVRQFTFNNSDAQKFSFHKQANGYYHICSKVGNRQVLDVDDGKTAAGTNIKIFTESNAGAQCFSLAKVEQPETGSTYNGKYTIKYAGGNNQVLDIAGGSKDNGGNVDIYDANSTDAQKFVISTDMDGYATIKNVGSGKVLDIENGWTYPYSNVQQYESNGTNAQRFKIIENDDGTVTFVPKCNENVALDVNGGQAKSGTNVWAYYLTFATSQKWILKDLEEDLPESTATFEDYFYQISPNSTGAASYGIEIAGASKTNGAIADMSIFSMDDQNKVFALYKNGNYYYIVNINSWKALDCGGSATSAGRQVHQWDLEYGNSNQMWGAYAQDDGSVKFICRGNRQVLSCASSTVAQGTRVVTVAGTSQTSVGLTQSDTSNVGATTWNLTRATFNPQNISGNFYVSSGLNYGKVLDVAAGSKDNGANVQIYDINRSGAQQWNISTAKLDPSDPDSIYVSTITNISSGKVLDVSGGNFNNGANVWQYTKNDSYAQKWLICDYNGKYIIRSLGNPYCVLDVSAGSTENGANVQIYSSNHSNAQLWEFTDTSVVVPESTATIEEGKYSINSNVSSTRGLNVTGNTYSAGTRVKLGTIKDNIGTCAFNIKKVGNYYHITNAESGNALAVNGVNVVTTTSNTSDKMQLWSARDKDGSIQFINVATGLYLNVENGEDKEGQNVNVYKDTATTAQLWSLDALVSPQGEQVNGSFYISMSKNYNQVVDVDSGSVNDGANIQIYSSNGSGAQKWNVTTDTNGIATIKNAQSGKVFDIANGQISSGSNVWQYSANGSNAQKFKFVKDGDGYRIYSAVNDYICVDVAAGSTANGANVQMYSANGSDAQKFMLFNLNPSKPTGTQVDIENTTYKISTHLNSNYVLDVAGGSHDNGANIQLYQYNASSAQIFWIEKSQGYYRFVNVVDGKCLDVDGGKVIPGTNVQLWDKIEGNANQLFAAFDAGDGNIIFQNVGSGLVLDLSCGTVALGQNIQVYSNNGSNAQKWVLTKATYSSGHSIMSGATTNVNQMVNFFISSGQNYPSNVYKNKGAETLETWCQIAYEEATWEGVDPAVLMSQAMYETGWLKFGGQVSAEQCNFGGLGATGAGSHPATFADVRTGLRAQVQHLKAYASTDSLKNPCVDPRFNLVSRGCAPMVEDLGGKWSTNLDYGQRIVELMNNLHSK